MIKLIFSSDLGFSFTILGVSLLSASVEQSYSSVQTQCLSRCSYPTLAPEHISFYSSRMPWHQPTKSRKETWGNGSKTSADRGPVRRVNSREQAAWTATKTTKENGPKRETYEVRAIRNQRPDGKCYDQHEMTSRQINFWKCSSSRMSWVNSLTLWDTEGHRQKTEDQKTARLCWFSLKLIRIWADLLNRACAQRQRQDILFLTHRAHLGRGTVSLTLELCGVTWVWQAICTSWHCAQNRMTFLREPHR